MGNMQYDDHEEGQESANEMFCEISAQSRDFIIHHQRWQAASISNRLQETGVKEEDGSSITG